MTEVTPSVAQLTAEADGRDRLSDLPGTHNGSKSNGERAAHKAGEKGERPQVKEMLSIHGEAVGHGP